MPSEMKRRDVQADLSEFHAAEEKRGRRINNIFPLPLSSRASHIIIFRSMYSQRYTSGIPPQCPSRGRAARWVTSSDAATANAAVLSTAASILISNGKRIVSSDTQREAFWKVLACPAL